MNTLVRLMLPAFVAAISLAIPLSVSADEISENPSGPYIGAGVGQFNTHIKHLDGVDDAIQNIRKSDNNSWKIYAGYRFIPWLRVEAAYVDFGESKDSFSATGSNGNYRVKLHGFSPAVILSAPIGPVELFAKAGEYYYNVDTHVDFDSPGPSISSSHSRNDFLWGGGLSFVVLHHLELRAEYEKLELKDASQSDAFWLSAAWRF